MCVRDCVGSLKKRSRGAQAQLAEDKADGDRGVAGENHDEYTQTPRGPGRLCIAQRLWSVRSLATT